MEGITTHCCELCSAYWDCELKWYRGERGEEQVCCPFCKLFYECNIGIIDFSIRQHEERDKGSQP